MIRHPWSGVSAAWARRREALGGFNLLPYRARDRRRLRRQVLGEMTVAALAGAVGVALWCGGQVLERLRAEAQRRQIEHQLAAWAPRLRAAEAAERARREARAREALSRERALPRERLVALFDVLQQVRGDGVRLKSIRGGEHDAWLEVGARDPDAAARWLGEIGALRGDWSFEVAGLQAGRGVGLRGPLAFSVRIRWAARGRPAPEGA
jgi:Tfp pilus assembly protein PilN